MPEGPEIAILTEGLRNILNGHMVTNLEITRNSRYHKKEPDGYQLFMNELPLKVDYIGCKGKFLYMKFRNVRTNKLVYVLQTFGLSGGWFNKVPAKPALVLGYDGGELYYADQRHFGTIKFTDNINILTKKLDEIGPDLMWEIKGDGERNNGSIDRTQSGEVKVMDWLEIMRKNDNRNITVVLMDQKQMSGIGNYVKCEALYRAKINPFAKIKTINDDRLKDLYLGVKEVLRGSYKMGNERIQKYSDINLEYLNLEFALKIYGKKMGPNGEPIKYEDTPDKRRTYWVPSVQIYGD